MRPVKVFFFLLLILLCFGGSIVDAESLIIMDPADFYNRGIQYMSLEMYREASEAFAQAGNFETETGTASSLYLYCYGKLMLQEADVYESKGYLRPEALTCVTKAMKCFSDLEKLSFLDASALTLYCRARVGELNGLVEGPFNSYASLQGVMDSDERYQRLSSGKMLVSVSHESEKTLVKSVFVPATIKNGAVPFAGPGKEYYREEAFTLTPGTEAFITGRFDEWYLIETGEELEKARLWVHKIRIAKGSNMEIPVMNMSLKRTIVRDSEIRYGPGMEYLSRNMIVLAGTQVVVHYEEGLFLLVEVVDAVTGQSVWGWVISEDSI